MIKRSIVKNLVGSCAMPHYVVQTASFSAFMHEVDALWDRQVINKTAIFVVVVVVVDN
jgi:hypothetical protein